MKVQEEGTAIQDIEDKTIELKPLADVSPAAETANGDEEVNFKINHCYLFFFTVTISIGSAMQVGSMLAENGQTGFVFAEKLGWNKAGTGLYMNTLVTVAGQLGVAIGSVLGSRFILMNGSNNLSRLFYLFNIISLCFNLLKLILNTYTILIGRLGYGICCGVLN